MSNRPRRGEIWTTDDGRFSRDLVVYGRGDHEHADTGVVVPVFGSEPDTGFGVDLGEGWAAPGLVTSLRKARLGERRRHTDVQVLTDVNNMLFKILATPDR